MNPCPTHQQLAQLLADQLADHERNEVECHVERCAQCQRALEQLSSPPEVPPQLALGPELHRFQEITPSGANITVERPIETGCCAWPDIPGYEVLRELGRGGMGVVYLARQVGLDRLVALKMILAGRQASSRDLARFRAEAEAIARLTHPNIVQIHEVGEQHGCPYFSLEYVNGGSLEEALRGAVLPAPQAARLIETLALAVRYAHEHGVIHRDLKPANVLLQRPSDGFTSGDAVPALSDNPAHQEATRAGVGHAGLQLPFTEDCIPKIADFGLAKREGAGTLRSQTDGIAGTPSYMAPEQVEGNPEQVGPHTDVYALGAILYECLTGCPPFRGSTLLDTLLLVRWGEPVPPSRLRPGLSRRIEAVCLKCLHKEPKRRYVSASELAQDLRAFLDGRPVRARPIGPLERLASWCRREPGNAALCATVVGLLLVLVVGSLVTAVSMNRQRDEAVINLRRAEQAEHQREEQLWRSYLDQVRARRMSGQAGRRFVSLQLLREAAALKPSLELRNEAIACMALTDVRELRRWPQPFKTIEQAFDDPLKRFAYARVFHGDIVVADLSDGRELARLATPGVRREVIRCFSPDGRFLAIEYTNRIGRRLQVWDLSRHQSVLDIPKSLPQAALCFHPHSNNIAVGQPDGTIVVYELPSGKVLRQLPKGSVPHQIAYSPDGLHLAESSEYSRVVSVRHADTGRLIASLESSEANYHLTWRSDGRLLAVACKNHSVYVWDMTGPRLLCLLRGHLAPVTQLAFHPSGEVLVSWGWDGMTLYWDPVRGQQLFGAYRGFRRFGNNGHLIAVDSSHDALWELAVGKGFRTLHHDFPGNQLPKLVPIGPATVDFSPDGRLVAAASSSGVRFWDPLTGQELACVQAPECGTVLFHPAGASLITAGGGGLYRWPLKINEANNEASIGPHERVVAATYDPPCRASWDQIGNLAAYEGPKARIVVLSGEKLANLKTLPVPDSVNSLALSPDGRWLAASGKPGMRIWDLANGGKRDVGGQDSYLAFSADSRQLVVGGAEEFTFWDTATMMRPEAKPTWVLRREGWQSIPGRVAFSRDGRLLALAHTVRDIKLLDPQTGRELATLIAPEPLLISWLCFSPDGTLLAAATENHVVQLWDLREIRQQLAELSLDWEQPAYPPPKLAKVPLKIRVLREEKTRP